MTPQYRPSSGTVTRRRTFGRATCLQLPPTVHQRPSYRSQRQISWTMAGQAPMVEATTTTMASTTTIAPLSLDCAPLPGPCWLSPPFFSFSSLSFSLCSTTNDDGKRLAPKVENVLDRHRHVHLPELWQPQHDSHHLPRWPPPPRDFTER